MNPVHVIGIDVGGTKIAAGCVSFPEGHIQLRRTIPTQPEQGGLSVLERTLSLTKELMAEVQAAGQPVQAIGLGLCELVDPEGRIASQSTIRWMDLPVHERFSELVGRDVPIAPLARVGRSVPTAPLLRPPFTVEADVRAAARAEARFGAGEGLDLFLYVTVGTGISSCLVIDGKPFVGARGATGTMASAPLGLLCEHCGEMNLKSLEEIASGPALVSRAQAKGMNDLTSGRDVVAAATAGNVTALEVVKTGGHALGAMVGLLINVLDPQAVIVGGGLGLSEGAYWESFCASARGHVWSEIHRDLPILRAATGTDAGIIGAAANAWGEK